MPNTKSAKKRLRQTEVRREHRLSMRRALRTQIRKVREAVKVGDAAAADAEFRLVTKKLDHAGSRNIIHQNAAARMKSRLSARPWHPSKLLLQSTRLCRKTGIFLFFEFVQNDASILTTEAKDDETSTYG
jgi:small subunit ribosomal protein S20